MATVSVSAPEAAGLHDARTPLTGSATPAVARQTGAARILLAEFMAFAGRRRLCATACLVVAGAALEGVGILLVLPILQMFLQPGAVGPLAERAPAGDWLYEIKYDGYRVLARVLGGEVRLFTRNGNDWTARLARQASELEKLGLGDSWLDGEMVVLNDEGLPDFQALQNAFDSGDGSDIHYCLFDAPFLNGEDLRHVAVEQRRAALQQAKAQELLAAVRARTGEDAGAYDVEGSHAAPEFPASHGPGRRTPVAPVLAGRAIA